MIGPYPPKLPARCDSCGRLVPFGQLPDAEYLGLLMGSYVRGAADELDMLERVDEFYERNPHLIGRIVPHDDRVEASDDPEVIRQWTSGVPYDEIDLPPEPEPRIESPRPGDAEVIEYLRQDSFDLVGRYASVRERIGQFRPNVRRVMCGECPSGELHLVAPPHWSTEVPPRAT